MSISAQFPVAQTIKMKLEAQLAQLEAATSADGALENEVRTGLDSLSREVAVLEGLALQEAGQRQAMWSTRVAELSSHCAEFRAAFDRYVKRTAPPPTAASATSIRAELFGDSNGAGGGGSRQSESARETLLRENDHWASAHRVADDALGMAGRSLAKLTEQRNRLKNIQRTVLDMFGSLGVSNTLVNLINRRERCNEYITYIGMVVTVIILALVYWWRFY